MLIVEIICKKIVNIVYYSEHSGLIDRTKRSAFVH